MVPLREQVSELSQDINSSSPALYSNGGGALVKCPTRRREPPVSWQPTKGIPMKQLTAAGRAGQRAPSLTGGAFSELRSPGLAGGSLSTLISPTHNAAQLKREEEAPAGHGHCPGQGRGEELGGHFMVAYIPERERRVPGHVSCL